MPWPLILFCWLNVILLVGFVVYLCNRATTATEKAAEFKLQSQTDLIAEFKALRTDVTSTQQKAIDTLAVEFKRLMEHSAAMHQGQALSSNQAIATLADNQGDHALKVLQTCLAAQEPTAKGAKPRDLRGAFQDINNNGKGPAPTRRSTVPANLMA